MNFEFIKCIFCKKKLSENTPIVKITELIDSSTKEEFQSYYAHAKCLYDAILLIQNESECFMKLKI